MSERSITIRPLGEIPQATRVLAEWFHDQWHDYDGRSVAAIEAQLAENFGLGAVPITFVAESGSDLIGTVSIDLSDLPEFDYLSPWLASLYVVPSSRRAGIGTALVQKALAFAHAHRISVLYLWTPRSTRLYKNCGWTVFDSTTYNSQAITLMRFNQWEKFTNR